MERLEHSKPRDYKEVEESLQNSIKFDWDGKVKRLQQLGQIMDWHLDEKVEIWLREAEDCYIMGSFKVASFFAGATLEIAMKAHALNWQPPEKFENKNFHEIINKFQSKILLNQKEKDIAFEIKNIRNYYGHGLINELANKAEVDGMKVIKRNVMITKKGVEQIPNTKEEIISKAENDDMKLTFTQFNAEQLAWKSILNLHTLLLKLFPYNNKQNQ